MVSASTHLEPVELEEIPVFRFVAPECIEGILDGCNLEEVSEGAELALTAEAVRNIYIVLSGQLRVQSRSGEEAHLIGRGGMVGDLFFCGDEGGAVTVTATERCRLLVMDEDLLWSLAHISHSAACNLLDLLIRRIRGSRQGGDVERSGHGFMEFGTVDALTGLYNSLWLETVLPRQMTRSSMAGKSLSLLMIDIDRFRDFISANGYPNGDRAIHTVARAIRDYLRPTELAARYGGDRFSILLLDADLEKARVVAERLRQKVLDTVIVSLDGMRLPSLTISIGIAPAEPGWRGGDFIDAAEAALFRAQEAGGNRVSA